MENIFRSLLAPKSTEWLVKRIYLEKYGCTHDKDVAIDVWSKEDKKRKKGNNTLIVDIELEESTNLKKKIEYPRRYTYDGYLSFYDENHGRVIVFLFIQKMARYRKDPETRLPRIPPRKRSEY